MGWLFGNWKKELAVKIALVEERLAKISDRLAIMEQNQTAGAGQIAELCDQVRKLGRLQYKMGQDTQGKLEGLSAALAAVQQWQAAHDVDKARLADYERQLIYMGEILLAWLDDLDLLAARLRESGQDVWQQLLAKWTSQILEALSSLGLQELKTMGTSFDARVAECLGTIPRPPGAAGQADTDPGRPDLPYEVAEVVKRGFIMSDGSLWRKAQVLVYEEVRNSYDQYNNY